MSVQNVQHEICEGDVWSITHEIKLYVTLVRVTLKPGMDCDVLLEVYSTCNIQITSIF